MTSVHVSEDSVEIIDVGGIGPQGATDPTVNSTKSVVEIVEISDPLEGDTTVVIDGSFDTQIEVIDVGGIGPQGPEGPQGPTGVVGSLGDISDVALTSVSADDFLQSDGSDWVNIALPDYVETAGDTMTGDLVMTGAAVRLDNTEGLQLAGSDTIIDYQSATLRFGLDVGSARPRMEFTNSQVIIHDTLESQNVVVINESGDITLNPYTTVEVQAELSMNSNKITDVADGTDPNDAVNKGQLDSHTHTDYVEVAGDTMTGQLLIDIGSNIVPLQIQGDAAQTANLLELQNSAGTNLAYFEDDGHLHIGDATEYAELTENSILLENLGGDTIFEADGSGVTASTLYTFATGPLASIRGNNELLLDSELLFYTNGTNKWTIQEAGNLVAVGDAFSVQTDRVLGQDGAVADPTYSFTDDDNTGFYRAGADQIGLVTGGVGRFTLDLNGLIPVSDTAMNLGSNTLRMGEVHALYVEGTPGSVSQPPFRFRSDTNTGMWSSGTGIINFSSASTEILELDGTSIDATVPYRAANGSAATPSISFTNDVDTGFYYTGTTGEIGVAHDGTVMGWYTPSTPAFTAPGFIMGTATTGATHMEYTNTGIGIIDSADDANATLLTFGTVGIMQLGTSGVGSQVTGSSTGLAVTAYGGGAAEITADRFHSTGTEALPGVTFDSGNDSGFYAPLNDIVALSLAGSREFQWQSTSFRTLSGADLGVAGGGEFGDLHMTGDQYLNGGTIREQTVDVNDEVGTTYTYVIGDAGQYTRHNNASAITVTVPPNASVAFPVGTIITTIQVGAGQVTFAEGSGVTINSTEGLSLRRQWSAAQLVKTATDTWDLIGDLEPSSTTSSGVAGDTTLTLSDFYVGVDVSSADVTITLPAAASSTGKVFHIKKEDSSGNSVIVDTVSGNIDGDTSKTFNVQYMTITVISDGTNWMIL